MARIKRAVNAHKKRRKVLKLAKGYFAICGDPLYKLLLPADSRSIFIERPHRAQSGRLYPPAEKPLDDIAAEFERLK